MSKSYDTISRQDAIEAFTNFIWVDYPTRELAQESAEMVMGQVPSAEPKTKTGEWVEVEKNEYEGFSIVNMRCNQCERYAYLVLPKGTKCVYDYCPWCKADMRGEEE